MSKKKTLFEREHFATQSLLVASYINYKTNLDIKIRAVEGEPLYNEYYTENNEEVRAVYKEYRKYKSRGRKLPEEGDEEFEKIVDKYKKMATNFRLIQEVQYATSK